MLLVIQNPRFRLLWIGGAFSDMGMGVYFMVHGWLTLAVTDSPFWVGATAGMSGLGLTSCSVLGGVLVDRLDRRNLVIGGQVIQAAMAFSLAVLVLSGHVQLWQILVLGFVDGAVAGVRIPARMALTLDIAGRDRLLSATAANFAAMAGMGIVAPLAGGAVVSAFDVGWAYVLIGGAYLASVAVLLRLRGVPRVERSGDSPWEDLRRGIRYVLTAPTVRALILMVLVTEAFGWSHESMMPVVARDVLGAGASGLGYLMAAGASGATVSTLVMSSVGDIRNKGRLMVIGLCGFGLFLMLFASSRSMPLAMLLLGLAYASVVLYEASLSTLLQTMVPNEMRGRVLSFQTLMWGMTGISGFHTGAIARLLGAPVAIAVGGGVVFLNALRLIRGASRFQEDPSEEAGD